MDESEIVEANSSLGQYGQREIVIEFNAEGSRKFRDITGQNIGRQLAIVIDGKCRSAPLIKQAIEAGRAQISGDFTKEEAETICNEIAPGRENRRNQR